MSNPKDNLAHKNIGQTTQSSQVDLSQLGERIKRARKEVGYSQKELGTQLKLSDKAVSAYEVGRAQPSLDTLQRIAKLTHCSLSFFLDEVDPDDVELQIKIKQIEQDLLEVKRLLQQRGK